MEKITEPWNKKESSEKEKRIRAITRIYYSNAKIQESLLNFGKDREVVPRYFENFGKRPDVIQYPSDINELVKKGATSFHSSEEIWNDPLQLNLDMKQDELNKLRKSWDLLIDIDSPFLDCSKIATKLIIEALEAHEIKNYGLKFSGSKGFHIIISGKAFPEYYDGSFMKDMFPEWPRAISQYLMNYIRPKYNLEVGKLFSENEISKRTNIKKEDLRGVSCVSCGRKAKEGNVVILICPICSLKIQRKDFRLTKRKLKCLNENCAGILQVQEQKKYFFCEYCFDPENNKNYLSSEKFPNMFKEVRGLNAEEIARLDLVLVASRHLFRMPYSLHEKTALASIVLTKKELENFSLKDADPFKVTIREYLPKNFEGEGKSLLLEALDWKKIQKAKEEKIEKKIFGENQDGNKIFSENDFKGVNENLFPLPIKKLLNGLEDGRKRGLFILITFLRSINYDSEKIIEIIEEWNRKNKPPLKEGYIKSQLDWHFRQRKKILPPNYDNPSFYKDLGLLDKKPQTKNPIVDVVRNLRKTKRNN